MSDFTTSWSEGPVPLPAAPEPIRPASGTLAAPKAAPAADPAVIREFVNDERNSRLAFPVGSEAAWHVRWRAEFSELLEPAGLLTAGDRIVLWGRGPWQLFGANGQPVATKPSGDGPATLDPRRGLLFAPNSSGLLAAYRLKDGFEAFVMMVGSVGRFEPYFLASRQPGLIVSSHLRDRDPSGPGPNQAMIELVRLSDPPKSWPDPDGCRTVKDLIRNSYRLLTALHGDSITLAADNRIYLLDANLEIRRALAGSFIPLRMSLDEAGRIYLVGQVEGRTALWLLSPQGERWYSFALPPDVGDILFPPIVAHDHTAYLLSAQRILSVAPDGKLNWMRSAPAAIAGAAVTADDLLLTAEGSSLVVWDAQGQRRRLHDFPGETLAAAPAFAADGDLLAATRTALYRLSKTKP